MSATVGQPMRLLAGLNGLDDGQPEALAKGRNDGSSERVAVLMKPQRSRLNGGLPVCETLSNALI
ncbi:MAG: hypothetical protein ACK4ZU_08330 [Allorhizobium sp.]